MTSFIGMPASGQAVAIACEPTHRELWQTSQVTMRQGWESEAANWAWFARRPGYDDAHENINRPALVELLPAPGRRTLDFACGEGRLARLLRSMGHAVVGVDASPSMVRLAVAHEDAARAVQADGSRLPFADATFDLVVAYMCLHDFDDMPQAVAEIGRVLEPSGRLCLAIPHPVNSAGSFASKDADAQFVISGSYMASTRTHDTVERGGVRLTFHSEHRPLEAYARALESAGLLIEALREAVPDDEVVARHPTDKRWQRIPLFLHMRVIKPA
jgi:SAM-dependent methyltransferase